MARRIGAEKVQHWSKGYEQFGSDGTPEKIADYSGCWVQFKSSDEDAAGSGVDVILSGIWIPAKVEIHESDDFFTWDKDPDTKYRTSGKVGWYYDRRGRLKASYVPVEVRS